MGSADPFARTDALGEDLLEIVAARLEKRGRHPRFLAMLDEYLEALGIDDARTLLDLGCGTGVVARVVARRPGFTGRVTGIDLSPHLVAVGSRLAAEEGVGEKVELAIGDTRRLDFPAASFDAVIAHTLLSHVDDPRRVLAEAARVLRPGGRCAVFDGDYASLTFGDADPQRGSANDEALVAAVVANPRILRDLPRLLDGVGLRLVAVFPHVLAEVGRADFWLSAIDVYERLMVQAGTMTAAAARAWADRLRQDSADGVFFGASNFYGYVARKP